MVVKRLFRTKIMILLVIVVILTMALPLSAHAQARTHVVQRGDTLYSIARRYGTSVQAIMSTNGLSNRNFIWVGQRLNIPGGSGGGSSSGGGSTQGGGTIPSSGSVHVVRRGETVASIARRYGTSVAAIAALNGLRNPNLIYAGQRLNIPKGGSSSGGGTAPPSSSGGAKWIDIDLSSQRLRAYAGNTVLRTMVVSTGIARYPTPPGRFRIYSKYPSVNMSGPGYYLPGVPHTMYFYRGYALHGTYWHNNFGRRMSHGCINLRRTDAAWLFNWSPHGILVVIHR